MAQGRRRNWLSLAAVGGFASVAFGAFAAHGIGDPGARELLRTGSLYGFVHCLATFAAVAATPREGARSHIAPALFLTGMLLFCGSLYALALGGPRWIGVVTPIGGVCFLGGWAVLAWAVRADRA